MYHNIPQYTRISDNAIIPCASQVLGFTPPSLAAPSGPARALGWAFHEYVITIRIIKMITILGIIVLVIVLVIVIVIVFCD